MLPGLLGIYISPISTLLSNLSIAGSLRDAAIRSSKVHLVETSSRKAIGPSFVQSVVALFRTTH